MILYKKLIVREINKLDSISDKIKQYGQINIIIRIIKKLLAFAGIKVDQHYVFKKNLVDEKHTLQSKCFKKEFTINKLDEKTIAPYLNTNQFLSKKIKTIKTRIKKTNYFCFGVFDNNFLIYMCWIKLPLNEKTNNNRSYILKKTEGLMLDAFCFPAYRGLNIHSYMNAYRLDQLYKRGVKKAVVLVIKENIPAIKSQLKVGFKKDSLLTVFRIFNKKFIYNKKYK